MSSMDNARKLFEELEASPKFEELREATDVSRYQEILSTIWLYIDWRYVTRQLTRKQKNLFADTVVANHRKINPDDTEEQIAEFDYGLRWWDHNDEVDLLSKELRRILKAQADGENPARVKRNGVEWIKDARKVVLDPDLTQGDKQVLKDLHETVCVQIFRLPDVEVERIWNDLLEGKD